MKRLANGSFAVLLLAASAALADEIRLKDGTKIIGTIVGFEDNSFKVETSYGFALVRKDKIAAIIPTETKPEPRKEAAAETTRPSAPGVALETPARVPARSANRQASPTDTSTERLPTPSPPRIPALEKGPLRPPVVARPGATETSMPPSIPPAASRNVASATGRPAAALAAQPPTPSPPRIPALEKGPLRPPVVLKATRGTTETSMPPSIPPVASRNVASAKGRPAPAAALVAQPLAPPEPPPIREEVQGNLYVNHTYGFRMYKPPSWQVIEGAQTALPSAIVAMGTDDETTLLVVAREPLKASLEAQATATERRLREIYENYRRISEHHTRVAGQPALASRYRGALDGHDWSGVVLSFARGNDVFTVLGMTYADSDLIQIQENVIAKTIASLQFTAQ
jgi:hypothetical protein